ncbi:MAG TPA: alpha-L-fucosidase, partial [Flavihumibacter sp.]|nr:alpha-L-fucosidase [Flavihumibacter sp.]
HKDMVGDYDTPEQTVGRMNMVTPWESCFTICDQWSWKPNDKMKSLKECLRILSQAAGGNGNLLLNVGPMPDGRIEARQATRLKEIGDWLKMNGEAVYGTLGGPYEPTNNYATTRKENKIFLHVINTDTAFIDLKGLMGRKIMKTYTMSGKAVSIQPLDDGYKIMLPAELTGKLQYIIVLELDGSAEAISNRSQ